MADSLQQYRDLYDAHRADIDAHAPAVMNAARAHARHVLDSARLPRRGDDGYGAVDINQIFAPDYGINIARMPFRADAARAFKCGVPNVSTLTAVVSNDIFAPTDRLMAGLPKGVTVCAFSRATGKAADALQRCYARIAPADNAVVALNTLLAQDGVLIYVERGVECTKPIQLINILTGAMTPLLAVRRVLVVLEEGARCSLLGCDHAAPAQKDVPAAVSTVVEIDLAADAALDWTDLEESLPQNSRVQVAAARVDRNATLTGNMATLTCGQTRNTLFVHLVGEHAQCHLRGMVIADGTMEADNSATVEHAVPHGTSTQSWKYVVGGESRCAFQGLVKVQPGAHHTDAAQNNRNMLVSDNARMHTRPQLEIYCDDVRAGHGSATGQLDAEALFYMRSRGIPAAEARTMLMQAFMADIVDAIQTEPLRSRMRHLVDMRLSGKFAACMDGEGCTEPAQELEI